MAPFPPRDVFRPHRSLPDVGSTLAEKRQLGLAQQPVPHSPNITRLQPKLHEVTVAEEARQFEELMDTFSLHHFIIRFGSTLDTTPEYISFQRKFQDHWGAIQRLVSKLEAIMLQFDVPLAYIDGQMLAALALDPLAPQVAFFLLMPFLRTRVTVSSLPRRMSRRCSHAL